MLSRCLRGMSPPSRYVPSLFIVVLFAVAAAGCGDETTGPFGNGSLNPFGLWSSSGEATYGQLFVTSQWYQKSNSPLYISGGEIFTTTGHDTLVSGGTMTASNLQVSTTTGQYTTYKAPTFGAVSAWGLSGNLSAGIPAFVDSMYVPAEIRVVAPGNSVVSVSKSSSMTVQWNADANNESVLLIVEYMPDESQMRDSTLPGTHYRWKVITDDDGSFTVNSSELAALPVGGLFQVILARGASKLSGTPSHPFHVYAYSTAAAMYAVAL